MKTAYSRIVWTMGLMGVSAAGMAGEPLQAPPAAAPTTAAAAAPAAPKTPPQEPVGFITGGVIGGFAAGPVGALIGAGIGTWLGNRVHRAGQAAQAEAQVARLRSDETQLEAERSRLQAEKGMLNTEKSDLAETNRALSARLDELSQRADAERNAQDDPDRDAAAKILDGLQGDVLFRTGSADITPEASHGIEVLAEAVAKSPALKVRVDGYADARGTADANLKLSQARADAVRDVFLSAGVDDAALEINAYGNSQSVAADSDGYALERRVRLTLQAAGPETVAQAGMPAGGAGGALPVGQNR